MTQDTPLPTPVGANTAVCTALGSLTNAEVCLGGPKNRIASKNCFQASCEDTLKLNKSHCAFRNDGFVVFVIRPMIGPRLAPSIPALRKSLTVAQRAVPYAVYSPPLRLVKYASRTMTMPI